MKRLRIAALIIGLSPMAAHAQIKNLKPLPQYNVDKDIPVTVGIEPDLPMVTPGGKLGHWGVGNGGDWLRINFARAREYAANVVLRINPNSLSRIQAANIREWILKNQKFLAADILQTEHVWVNEEKPSCAFTVPPGADGKIPTANPIQLSYPTCRSGASAPLNFMQIAQLLIHEATHHFNADETTADLIAIGIMDAWQSGLMDSIPLGLTNAPSSMQKHTAVWTGESMIVVGGFRDEIPAYLNTVYSYNPGTGEWTDLNPPAWFTARGQANAIWTGSEVFIWGGYNGNSQTTTWSFNGALYNPSTKAWTQVAAPDFWKPAQPVVTTYPVQTAVWTGDKVIVWGGYDSSNGALGAIFDPATRTWSKMSLGAGAPRTQQGHSAVWTGSTMIVWGGYSGNNVVTDYGAIYNPATDSWTTIADKAQGAPTARAGHQAVWTGNAMVIISGGGTATSTDLTSTGGLYYPATNSWTSYRSELMTERFGHRVVWNGEEILLIGGQSKRLATYCGEVYAFNPFTLRWRILPGSVTPPPRSFSSIVWTGSSALVWGGYAGSNKTQRSGAQYFP
jgi:N-acetylneuraminic acid mutarotase